MWEFGTQTLTVILVSNYICLFYIQKYGFDLKSYQNVKSKESLVITN